MTERYDRQTLLPEIGQEGQRRLKQARVLIVGIGGLGSPAALYLAGAGVGTLGLVDDDSVSLTNLHRQVLYTQSEVGQPKVRCAARRLKALNPEVQTEEYAVKLAPENAYGIISRYDIVIDGCDNPATRYLLSDTCAALHIPYIYGAITPFGGQVATLCSHKGARTYRDLFPTQEEITAQTAGKETHRQGVESGTSTQGTGEGEGTAAMEKNPAIPTEEDSPTMPSSTTAAEKGTAIPTEEDSPATPSSTTVAEKGVIGPTPAIIGSMQAAEAMKIICHFGTSLADKLWTIDLLTMQTFIFSI